MKVRFLTFIFSWWCMLEYFLCWNMNLLESDILIYFKPLATEVFLVLPPIGFFGLYRTANLCSHEIFNSKLSTGNCINDSAFASSFFFFEKNEWYLASDSCVSYWCPLDWNIMRSSNGLCSICRKLYWSWISLTWRRSRKPWRSSPHFQVNLGRSFFSIVLFQFLFAQD